GSSLCNAFVTVLNLIAIARIVPEKPRLVTNFLRSLIPSLLMGAAAWGTWLGLRQVLGADGSRVLLCGVPVVIGVIAYCVLAILCKSITREDCLLLPKGEKIANLLHL
ncbi:MAG: polysaccharide biosynthesis C-terminal domain-containing protein, partial [Firmicutes bacterium]|nr:polysaccharide biosynthesis C-terminal domain-containing protein [Bacillota bacterium]